MKNPFRHGDQAYILDKKVYVTQVMDDSAYTNIGWCPISVLSFAPYTAEGITHEKPKPKPAGMFWDDTHDSGLYGVLMDIKGVLYVNEKGNHWNFFQEMTFDEYRKLKGL